MSIKKRLVIAAILSFSFVFLFFVSLFAYNIFIFYDSNIATFKSKEKTIESNFSSINLNFDGIYDKGTKALLAGYDQNDKKFLYSIGRLSYYGSSDKTKPKDTSQTINIHQVNKKGHIDKLDNYLISDLVLDKKSDGKTYVFDIIVSENKLYISFVNFYNSSILCDKFSIISLDIDTDSGQLSNPKQFWTAKPCMHLLAGQWFGFSGRMAADDNHLYMIAGLIVAELYTNIYPERNNSTLMNNLEDQLEKDQLFGRIIKIDKQSSNSESFARGFRSPGGLFLDKSSGKTRIWATDHGPRGGDELNLIYQSQDYGWPYVSMGEPYIMHSDDSDGNVYRLPTRYKSHDGYEAPFYYWTPSIGISQVIVLKEDLSSHDDWVKGDVIVSSLKAKSLFHMKIGSNMKVKSVEKIEIGHRIRSLLQFNDALYMSTDDGQIIRLSFNKERVKQGEYPPVNDRSNHFKYQLDPMKYLIVKIFKGLDRRVRPIAEKVFLIFIT